MIGFVLNPPGSRRRRMHRKSRRSVARVHKTSKAAMRWKRSVAKYGVRGAAERRSKRRAAAKKARRTLLRKKASHVRRKRIARKVVVPMARRKRSRKARRVIRRRKSRRGARRARRSRKMRRNPVEMNPRRRSRRKARRSRKAGRRTRRSRRMRRNSWPGQPIRHRRAARRAWRKHRRTMLPAVRRNVRKALNRKFGARRWVKHSRAKWNPGTSLSIGGVGSSITKVFSLENLYDGLAIGGGIIGALALPRLVDRVIPEGIKSKLPFGISLSTGWFSYVASAGASGLLGYLAGWAFGRRYGEKVFWGGIGATIAKALLDYVTPIRSFTGVGLSAYDSSIQRVIESEVARELAAGGMASYVSPQQVAAAQPLGDYATPEGALTAGSLGEFSEGEDFDA